MSVQVSHSCTLSWPGAHYDVLSASSSCKSGDERNNARSLCIPASYATPGLEMGMERVWTDLPAIPAMYLPEMVNWSCMGHPRPGKGNTVVHAGPRHHSR
jgi:hypothetical protein